MSRPALALAALLATTLGCDEPRARGGAHPDRGTIDGDAGRVDAGPDAASPDAASPDAAVDAGGADAGSSDATPPDSGPPDSGALDAAAPPDSGPRAICGDGRLDPGETCDDGVITSGCDTAHDGGDGTCLPPGQCVAGYVLDGNGDCVPAQADATVIIDVDNFCNMTVTPTDITVPPGQSIMVDWFNRSRDYPVDVWLSYGGGYLDLATGATWDEPIPHCTGPNPHTEYADISTACSSFRLLFHCQ